MEFDAIWSALREGRVDLAVLDAQYLAACGGLVARIDSIGPRDLREQGIPRHMVDACQFGDALYGLPLNADAPMLVVNRALAPDADKALAAAAAKAQRDKAPRGFWEELVRQAGPQRRIGLELGDYEGGTVVLLELLTACGLADVLDPDTLQVPLTALREGLFAHRDRFDLHGLQVGKTRSALTEGQVYVRFAAGLTAFARVWPAFAHHLAV
jgi:hypothetical protein